MDGPQAYQKLDDNFICKFCQARCYKLCVGVHIDRTRWLSQLDKRLPPVILLRLQGSIYKWCLILTLYMIMYMICAIYFSPYIYILLVWKWCNWLVSDLRWPVVLPNLPSRAARSRATTSQSSSIICTAARVNFSSTYLWVDYLPGNIRPRDLRMRNCLGDNWSCFLL